MLITNETLNTIHTRRSCRAYTAQQVGPDKLDAVIDAGLWAASGMGRQSQVIAAVQDKDAIAKLSAINASIMAFPATPSTARPPCWWCWPAGRSPPRWRTAA